MNKKARKEKEEYTEQKSCGQKRSKKTNEMRQNNSNYLAWKSVLLRARRDDKTNHSTRTTTGITRKTDNRNEGNEWKDGRATDDRWSEDMTGGVLRGGVLRGGVKTGGNMDRWRHDSDYRRSDDRWVTDGKEAGDDRWSDRWNDVGSDDRKNDDASGGGQKGR